jgi:epoxyqueuosine reductase QueG
VRSRALLSCNPALVVSGNLTAGVQKREDESMDVASIKQWVRNEILRRGFNGGCAVASFSDVYNDLMPVQRKEVEKICAEKTDTFLRNGSIISVAIFHSEKAIKSINTTRDHKVDYEKWNFYADEYNTVNNVLNGVSAALGSVLDGIALKATSELGGVQSVEEYYPYARISHRVVAEHAGLGKRGKNELIVTRQNGSAVRLNSFLTPKELKGNDNLVEDLCGDCRACLDSCRILLKKEKLQNYRQQCMEKINALNLKYPVCGICVRACYENGHWKNTRKQK